MRCLFLILLAAATAATAATQPVGTFVPTGSMTEVRSQHTATLLQDGRVLFTGGVGAGEAAVSSAEIYDPATGAFSPTGSMSVGRRMHTATLLQDGRVLVAGGWATPSAEIYDPATGTFASTGSLLESQAGHSATLLPGGKVLIAGGETAVQPSPAAGRAELYDPATGTFSFASDYAERGTLYIAGGPIWPTANLLHDGRVLIVGENPPEVYDGKTNTFSVTGRLIEATYLYGMEWHAATTLRDGSVLITGGNDDNTCGGFNDAELYDPASGTFSVVGPMNEHRDIHTSTLLQDGTVLVIGGGDGWCGSSTHDSAELYIPSTRTFIAAGHMAVSRTEHTATLLNDGSVLIAGGASYWPYGTSRSAELYRPAVVRTGRSAKR